MGELSKEGQSLDFTTFDDVMREQYGVLINENGEIWGLVAGDQGYDSTGITIQRLVYGALAVAEDKGMDSVRAGTPDWDAHTGVQDALCKLISVCRAFISPAPPTDAGGPGSASNTDTAQERHQCPSCHWHHGHDPAEWFTEEAKRRGFLELVKRERVPFVLHEEVAESSPTQTVAPPGPTAGDVERARELLLGWMNTRPAGVYQSSIQSTEFQRLIELIADALGAACAELLAQIREPSEDTITFLWDIAGMNPIEARNALRFLANKVTEAK